MRLTLNDIAHSAYPIGLECEHCIRRSLIDAETVGATRGDYRTLEEAEHRCRCGCRRFGVERFYSESKAHAFLRNV